MSVFNDNRTAIEGRVLGAVTRYFLALENNSAEVSKETLQKLFHFDHKTENLVSYYNSTIQKVARYFATESTDGSWSDFQCTLALDIYKDYVKK